MVDGQPPVAKVRIGHGVVSVKLSDHGSGLKGSDCKVSFGDGTTLKGRSSYRHRYAAGGSFQLLVRAGDKVGNRLAQRFQVRVR
jgi:hypothetical protein